MATKNEEPYLDWVSEGVCEVLDCSNPAAYRASWVQASSSGLCAVPTRRRWKEGFSGT